MERPASDSIGFTIFTDFTVYSAPKIGDRLNIIEEQDLPNLNPVPKSFTTFRVLGCINNKKDGICFEICFTAIE